MRKNKNPEVHAKKEIKVGGWKFGGYLYLTKKNERILGEANNKWKLYL